MNRRRFLEIVSLAGPGQWLAPLLSAQGGTGLRVDVNLQDAGRRVPENFTGLSYELSQLTEPDFFSSRNTELIAFFQRLSPFGVLRIGGNSSEFCWFRATPSMPALKLNAPTGDPSQNWMPHHVYAIDPIAIDNLADFLAATGWKAIYGLNYGHSTPERAATEAAYVHAKLGDRLQFFQIGNEPDFYRDANNGVRPAGWGFDEYVREWVDYANAVTARVPNARFGGPDTGASSDWVIRFGKEVAPRLGKRLVALTGHYYAEGPPDALTTTTARLLGGDPRVKQSTTEIVKVADAQGLVYRMTEGNSCYRGGKPGMSNAFASALWAADYMLELAGLGCAGVNLHGGKSGFLSASLGDHHPGASVDARSRFKRLGGYYTPISSEDGEPTSAMPVFYGMMLAQQFAGAQMLVVEQPANPLVRVYAALKGGRVRVAVINKGMAPVSLALRFEGASVRELRSAALRGAALDATMDVTFAGATVANRTAAWLGKPLPALHTQGGVFHAALSTGAVLLEQV